MATFATSPAADTTTPQLDSRLGTAAVATSNLAGREMGAEVLNNYTEVQAVTIKL